MLGILKALDKYLLMDGRKDGRKEGRKEGRKGRREREGELGCERG